MRKNLFLVIVMSCMPLYILCAKSIDITSPDRQLQLAITITDKIFYSVSAEGKVLLENNSLHLDLKDDILGQNPQLKNLKETSVSNVLHPVVPLKFAKVEDTYNQLILNFKGDYSVEFRVYNDGVAYRFVTKKTKEVQILNEGFDINFPAQYKLHIQQPGSFKTAYEEPYSHIQSNEWKSTDKMSTLPVLVDTHNQYKILISESDLSDYPCLFLKSNDHNGLQSVFPKEPLEFGEDGDRSQKILKEADYIAKTKGSRSFPWRYFLITKDDRQILENTMTYKLASKSLIADPSWIKPGQVSWEWWNDASPYGMDVNFEAGYNLDTYKYYIDFASKYHIPYIIMDEGWAKSTYDPYTPNPKVDVHELIRYGKEKNVGIILWLTWLAVENNMDLFKTFSEWGVKGVKIDFMDRSDQWMVNYYERVAKVAAENKILVDFHGSFKPAGLEYKYPNVLSYEGVRGQEQMGGCKPDNTVYLPFIRNAVGPMDFTPGAMINMQPDVYCSNRPNSASMGTRAYNMAMFVVFESGLQMLCDNPTQYYKNSECTDFITSVPTTWDETRALVAEVGEVLVVAKRKSNKWYIGGMTNGTKCNLDINFDFLGAGKSYTMTYFEDGINANRQAMDYRKKEKTVISTSSHQISMARNGGWAAIIE